MGLNLGLLRQKRQEPIKLLASRHNYFPQRFMWRGQRYDIHNVERAWTISKRGGKVTRHFFRVRCSEGTFELYQDLALNTWYLARRLN